MERIGRYEIVEELGRGSMGAVFKARDPEIGRIVAIKIILTTTLTSEDLALYKQRFRREAQAAGQMSHPGIITIHDIAETEAGQPYLVMEFIEGTTLHRMLRPAPTGKIPQRLSLQQTLDITMQVAEALDYAHRRGVIHRDIKPGNILITPEGRAKIADFGIAKFSGTEATHTATLVGTPAYMSPEQCRGGVVDARSDIFSLGSMLYWMCTGEKPFPGETLTIVTFKVAYQDPVPARQVDAALPADLEIIFSRCLAKNPEHRYQSARELATDLAAVKAGKRITRAPAPGVAPAEETVKYPPAAAAGAAPGKTAAAAPAPEVPARAVSAPSGWLGKSLRIGAVVVALLAVGLAGFWLWPTPPAETPPTQAADAAPAAAETPPASPPTEPAASVEVPPPPPPPEAATQEATPAETEATPPPPEPPRMTPVPAPAKPKPKAKTSAQPPPAGVTPASGESQPPPPPPPVESAPAEPPKSRPAATSTLEIECKHNFRDGKLEILAGGRKVFETKLEGESRVLGKTSGTLRASAPIRAGQQVLTVRVSSAKEEYKDEAEIGGTFPEGRSRKLKIEFGKGSGLGVAKRKLTLSLK